LERPLVKRAVHPLFLGIEFTTTSVAAVLIDVERRVQRAEVRFALANSLPGDLDAERDRLAEGLRHSLAACTRNAEIDPSTIGALAIHSTDESVRRHLDQLLRGAEIEGGGGTSEVLRVPTDAASWLGLAPSTLIAPNDSRAALLAIGCGATREGLAATAFEPHGMVIAPVAEPIVDPDLLLTTQVDSRNGTYAVWNLRAGESLLDELRVGFSTSNDLDPSTLESAAEAVPIGAHGVTILPFLEGEDLPDLDEASAAILGLTTSRFRASILHRAALEGLTFALALGVDRMRALGVGIDVVRLVGRGAMSVLRQRIVASILETRVVGVSDRELIARGCALRAAAEWFVLNGDDISLAELAWELSPSCGAVVEPAAEDIRACRKIAEQHHVLLRRLYRGARNRRDRSESSGRDARGRRQGRLFEL